MRCFSGGGGGGGGVLGVFIKSLLKNDFHTNDDRVLSISKCKRIMLLSYKNPFISGVNCTYIFNIQKAMR